MPWRADAGGKYKACKADVSRPMIRRARSSALGLVELVASHLRCPELLHLVELVASVASHL